MRVSVKMSVVACAFALAGAAAPAFADSYYRGTQSGAMPMDGYYAEPVPEGVYVDPMPTGSIYVDPAPGYVYRPPARSLGDARERQRNEYQGSGQGDYYLGITPPAPAP